MEQREQEQEADNQPFGERIGVSELHFRVISLFQFLGYVLPQVIGIALGAFLSATMSGSRRASFSPAWTRMTGVSSLWGRMAMGFAGGFVLLLGARIAGGCTSGHGISGMAQLAVGSTVAVAAMFAGGILTAAMFKKV